MSLSNFEPRRAVENVQKPRLQTKVLSSVRLYYICFRCVVTIGRDDDFHYLECVRNATIKIYYSTYIIVIIKICTYMKIRFAKSATHIRVAQRSLAPNGADHMIRLFCFFIAID